MGDVPVYLSVSIHAPAKGATTRPAVIVSKDFLFQSTLPRRERHYNSNKSFVDAMFQSTLPRRERHRICAADELIKRFQSTLPRRERREPSCSNSDSVGFNPRSREGSDCDECGHTLLFAVSIHAPAKGATEMLTITGFGLCVSIHAPAKGATLVSIFIFCISVVSIHAPAKGATG